MKKIYFVETVARMIRRHVHQQQQSVVTGIREVWRVGDLQRQICGKAEKGIFFSHFLGEKEKRIHSFICDSV